ncbi:snaclec alboaggregin-D subunit beta-like [Ruditapes philippinarum]|uniref:snaclec alboaggregin-D subunit beta-like n=1 Tax=Ruditapes philippinarum TaxID=129788 RepID=UPI00295B19FE|nr:snaclec alboaggregin-D subunit beta-like [Ruditapes philippinarum]
MKLLLVIFVLHTGLGFLLDDFNRNLYRCPPIIHRSARLFTYGQYCIEFVVGNPTYWSDARDYCHHRGGTLVSIPDSGTQKFLMKAVEWQQFSPDSKGLWIGLNDRSNENHYVWENGDGLHGFTYWGKDEPSKLIHFAQDCVVLQIKDGGHWWDEPCGLWPFTYNFICQYDMLPTTTHKTTHTTSNIKTTTASTPMKTTTTTVRETTLSTTSPTTKTTTPVMMTTTVACQDIDCQKSCPGGYSGVFVGNDGCISCRCI